MSLFGCAFPVLLALAPWAAGGDLPRILRGMAGAFTPLTATLSALAVASGVAFSLLLVDSTALDLVRRDQASHFDPLYLDMSSPDQEVLGQTPKLAETFLGDRSWDRPQHFNFLGSAALPLLLIAAFLSPSRLCKVFLAVLAWLVTCMFVSWPYLLWADLVPEITKARHLNEILRFGGAHYAWLACGYGIEVLLGPARLWTAGGLWPWGRRESRQSSGP